jgi:hypothetical protein
VLGNQTLSLPGDYIHAENFPLTIDIGASMFGFYGKKPVAPELFFNYISGPALLNLIKDENGQIWWPLYHLNSIGELQPGEGYHIRHLTGQTYPIYPHYCD